MVVTRSPKRQPPDSPFQVKALPYHEIVDQAEPVRKDDAIYSDIFADQQQESLYDHKEEKPAEFLSQQRPQLTLNEPRVIAPQLTERRLLPQYQPQPPLQTEFLPPGASKINYRDRQLEEPAR